MRYYKRYLVVKELKKSDSEKLRVGDEIRVMGDMIFYNGGMVTPEAYSFLSWLINREKTQPEYLREAPVPYNKA